MNEWICWSGATGGSDKNSFGRGGKPMARAINVALTAGGTSSSLENVSVRDPLKPGRCPTPHWEHTESIAGRIRVLLLNRGHVVSVQPPSSWNHWCVFMDFHPIFSKKFSWHFTKPSNNSKCPHLINRINLWQVWVLIWFLPHLFYIQILHSFLKIISPTKYPWLIVYNFFIVNVSIVPTIPSQPLPELKVINKIFPTVRKTGYGKIPNDNNLVFFHGQIVFYSKA